jgi:hypothetical protein
VLVLQTVHDTIIHPLHLFLEHHLYYPQFSMHVNAHSAPLIDKPPMLEDWPGAFGVNCASLVDYKDITGNGFDGGCGIHGGSLSLGMVVTRLSQV